MSGARKHKSLLLALLVIAIFAVAMAVLHHFLARLSFADVLDGLRAVPPRDLLASAGFAACSYGMLTLYDYLALRGVHHGLPWRKVATTSFIAFAISHFVGLSSVSGGSIRYRSYAPAGLSAFQIAGVIAMVSITFALGSGSLLAVSLALESRQAAQVLHLEIREVRALAVLLAAAITAYVLLTRFKRTPIHLRSRNFILPPFAVTLGQIAVSGIDLCFAAATLYVLLPHDVGLNYFGFVGLYVLAIFAGVASNVPGGIGVFESVLIPLFPDTVLEGLVAAVLLYRLIYYLVPFLLGLALLAGREVHERRHHFLSLGALIRGWLDNFAPQVLAVAVFIAGAVLLFSGATPAIDSRIDWLRDFVPYPVLELSHLAGSAVGVGLLILARGLHRRLDGAWWTTMLLIAGGIVASLLKGLDWEEALLLSAVALVLWLTRERFYRRASLLDLRSSRAWVVATVLVVGAAVLLSIASYRDVQYAHELWWQFAFDDDAPRAMRAGLFSMLLAAGYVLLQLMSPVREEAQAPAAADVEDAARIAIASHDTLAHLALLCDKQFLFAEARDAFIMYQRSGRSIVALGDPAGNPARFDELAWKFRELCDRQAGWPVFYQVTEKFISLYLDLGLALAKLGEEARVYLPEFTLEGSKRQSLRNEYRRGPKDGASFRMLSPEETAAAIPRLQEISDQWLLSKSAAEKGFSIGRFEPEYIRRSTCAAVMREGRIVAFANLWLGRDKEEFSIDLMRFGTEAPRGVMDYLFVELILWGKAQGYGWFNLGMAPLAGLEKHPLAPFWHKLGVLVHRYGEPFYNFEGLRRYKEKFSPQWRPRYLASPGGLALPRVILDTAALIAGGVREVAWK